MNNNNNWNHPANHPSTITREQLLAALATYTKASQGTGDVHTFVHGLTLFLDGQVMANLTNERLDATRDNLKKIILTAIAKPGTFTAHMEALIAANAPKPAAPDESTVTTTAE